jgi:hypothetical protein
VCSGERCRQRLLRNGREGENAVVRTNRIEMTSDLGHGGEAGEGCWEMDEICSYGDDGENVVVRTNRIEMASDLDRG